MFSHVFSHVARVEARAFFEAAYLYPAGWALRGRWQQLLAPVLRGLQGSQL